MVFSLRAFGYDLPMAIADLIDNSISAGATTISVDYDWADGYPWFRVSDDGRGMSEDELREAMRLGTRSPLDDRDYHDLGRFGLGLKTASFSQGRLLTVATRDAQGTNSVRAWDLDHVCNAKAWELLVTTPEEAVALATVSPDLRHGTSVLCQKLDRVVNCDADTNDDARDVFLNRFGDVARYLEMVMHRYLAGKDPVRIRVGRHECEPWDPFMRSNRFTEQLPTETLAGGRVIVTPFILPHVSNRSQAETATGSGVHGWNAHQGFYVYRNRRMIIPGGYLDFAFTPEEHYKLCRIRVDLPNDMDHEWSLDVRKACASPPSGVRRDLVRIAKASRQQAVRVYRARTGSAVRSRTGAKHDVVWLKKRRGDKVVYQINQEHQVIRQILSEVDASDTWIRKLFHMIEKTVPHRLIIMDNAEHEDCQVDLPPEVDPPPTSLLDMCRTVFERRVREGTDPNLAADVVCALFDDHPAYRAMLDHLIETME